MVIRHVGVWSVARLYGALSAAAGLLFGGIFAVAGLVGGMAGFVSRPDSGFQPIFSALFGVGAIIILPIFYGALGLISGAIGAALYNLFADMIGGIEIDVS